MRRISPCRWAFRTPWWPLLRAEHKRARHGSKYEASSLTDTVPLHSITTRVGCKNELQERRRPLPHARCICSCISSEWAWKRHCRCPGYQLWVPAWYVIDRDIDWEGLFPGLAQVDFVGALEAPLVTPKIHRETRSREFWEIKVRSDIFMIDNDPMLTWNFLQSHCR